MLAKDHHKLWMGAYAAYMLNVSFVFLCLFVLSREVHDGKLFRELVQLVEFVPQW
jgi:hypothetical protein